VLIKSVAWVYWDPPREIFTIPFLNMPILWYSILFAIGFVGGYYLFRMAVSRYFYNFPYFTKADIKVKDEDVEQFFDKTKKKDVIDVKLASNKHFGSSFFSKLNALISNKEDIDVIIKKHDTKNIFLKLLSSCKYFDNKATMARKFLDKTLSPIVFSIKEKSSFISDKVLIYIFMATLIGARLGHVLFYEKPSYYLSNPLVILQVWEGGLASHGAAIAIIIAMIVFVRRKKHIFPPLSFLRMLDLIAMPTSFAAICIRMGNFFNQEVLGTVSYVPWAVVFGHPADNLAVMPRHPAQLYEAIFYLAVFLILLYFSGKPSFFLKKGKMMGLFFILVFGFRFFIEFFKVEQSYILSSTILMGQVLSIPLIILGFILFFWTNAFSTNKNLL
jgi:phosphatidylglycerol---prolipoprotein diacylglyceryl transferase